MSEDQNVSTDVNETKLSSEPSVDHGSHSEAQEDAIFQPTPQTSGVMESAYAEAPASPSAQQNDAPSNMTTPMPQMAAETTLGQTSEPKKEFVRKKNHEESHFWFANLFMCFIFPFVCRCKPVVDEDMPVVHTFDMAKPATERFLKKYRVRFDQYIEELDAYEKKKAAQPADEHHHHKLKEPKRPGMMGMLITTQSSYTFPIGVIMMLLQTAIQVMQPFMSKGVLNAIVDKTWFELTGGMKGSDAFPFFYVIWMILSPTVTHIMDSLSNRMFYHFSARARSAIVGALYDKVFRIKNMASAGSADTGRILSLVSTDSRTVAEMLPLFMMLFALPLYIIIPLIFLIVDFKWVVVVPIVVMILVLIPNFFLIQGMMSYVKAYMAYNDQRNKITNETFQGIRVVKYSGLESVFKSTINVPREKQIHTIRMQTLFMQLMGSVMRTSMQAINLATFSVYCAVFSDDPTNFATTVMPNMGYLMMMTMPTTMLPMYLEALLMIRINTNRLAQFLYLPEMEEVVESADTRPADPANAIEITNGEFKWGSAPAIPLTQAEETALKKEAEQRKKEAKLAAAKEAQAKPHSKFGGDAHDDTTPKDQPKSNEMQETEASPQDTQSQKSDSQIFKPSVNADETGVESNAQDEVASGTANPTVTPSLSPAPSRTPTAFSGTTNADGPTLMDVNVTIPKGSLTMIVGEVGSGKSSLGSAIVGDIERLSGTIRTEGRITYCPQTPWINNNTVRGNITFNADYDEAKYNETVRVCALEPDFKIFAAGDQTAIGEKGVNMSGGQKARIQLARAIYSDKDIYILDDPLSAVDAHVGRYLMDECICGVLKGKTVILMTNQLQFLDRADKVIALENGRITAQGTYAEIREQGVNFDEFIIKSDKKAEKKKQKKVEVKEEEKTDEDNAKQIITEEEQETGGIKFMSYVKYLRTLMPMGIVILFLLYVVAAEAVSPVSTWWLGKISSQTAFTNVTFWWKIGIYGFLTIGIFVLLIIRAFMTAAGVGRSARVVHNQLLDNVMNCPSSFFDTTPMGRILNRFTGDIPQVDQFLFSRFLQVVGMWVGLIGQIVIIGVDTPWFLAIGIPVLVLYIILLLLYSPFSRNLQRLESIARSPVLSHFSESVTGAGLTTIRSYGREEEWKEKFYTVNDELSVPFMLFREGQKWASLYASVISTILFAGVMLIGWFFMDASKLSVAIMSSMTFTNLGLQLIQMTVELESKMTSFERVEFYTSKLPQEAQTHEQEVPDSWPQRGDVTFDRVKYKYRPGLPFVLKGVDFEVKGGEKIGVCGRTGAGKSSLLFVLFRLVELDPKLAPKMIDMKTGFPVDPDPNEEPNSGRILIDGVDISKLDIHRVRRSVAIIPQDPTLFTGTIRYNLDLAGKASDDRIWEVLEMIEMRDIIAGLPYGLDSQVAEGGSNFSAGQRQLLCFGRAILNNCRVVVMDEATANVDVETDAKIQRTIREQFREQTVIVIAHRLNTIMDSTRIMVMDQGYLSEFDTPENLKANPDSAFNALIQSLNH
ncbi:Multidrug resistance-associated protein [Blattamonas nauphoetae]|uniref:Multidrug resistance-associated protein n=1 Tax=Blattamonas nauphoetae TaxID=2049346 RepID=A0ABQ9XAZ3_9EUKA|nr:Multidrug resistance-associated protein [Blattamonas nauphoetae]